MDKDGLHRVTSDQEEIRSIRRRGSTNTARSFRTWRDDLSDAENNLRRVTSEHDEIRDTQEEVPTSARPGYSVEGQPKVPTDDEDTRVESWNPEWRDELREAEDALRRVESEHDDIKSTQEEVPTSVTPGYGVEAQPTVTNDDMPFQEKPPGEPPSIPLEEEPLLVRTIDEIEQLLALNFFGICGSIGRNGLVELLGFENLGSVWPNFTACFVIALIPVLLGPILSPSVGTGFCGSMSSFSELITDVFTEATTPQANWPDHGYGVPLFMARLLLEMCCSFAGYAVGGHTGLMLQTLDYKCLSTRTEVAIRRVCEALGVAAWVVCLVTTITSENRVRVWPLCGVFAPVGVYARFYLSKLNTTHWFKWGTFLANILATAIACVCVLCLDLPSISPLQSQMVRGVQKGFCGCFSTISTFVRELNTQRLHHSYFYGLASLFVAYSLAFIIIGSYIWTR